MTIELFIVWHCRSVCLFPEKYLLRESSLTLLPFVAVFHFYSCFNVVDEVAIIEIFKTDLPEKLKC